jgi:DNA-directed RNA polymerase I, II, and III subunit RPABC3
MTLDHLLLTESDLCRTAYASFGGLLMSLTGSFRHMTNVVLGDPVYLLMRK